MKAAAEPAEALAAPGDRLVRRFGLWSRLTHGVLAVSVFGLALTGMPLKYSNAFWAEPLMRIWGGPHEAGIIHRVFAGGFFLSAAMHLSGLAVGLVRRRLGPIFGPDSILPRLDDVGNVPRYLRYLRGRGPKPDFGRFAYWEKLDYLAEFWGLLIIGLSGLIMWFPEIASIYLPGWIVNASLIFHSYEALLAIGFLFAIHFFNTHLRPEVFPLDDSIFTGTVPEHEVAERYPGWYRRLPASVFVPPRPPTRVVKAVRVFGIAFAALGIVTLALVMSAAIQEAVRELQSVLK